MEKLDLHGVKHEDVRAMMVRVVERHWGSSADLEVVTGNSREMTRLVVEVLREYGVEFSVGGVLGVRGGTVTVSFAGT